MYWTEEKRTSIHYYANYYGLFRGLHDFIFNYTIFSVTLQVFFPPSLFFEHQIRNSLGIKLKSKWKFQGMP